MKPRCAPAGRPLNLPTLRKLQRRDGLALPGQAGGIVAHRFASRVRGYCATDEIWLFRRPLPPMSGHRTGGRTTQVSDIGLVIVRPW